MIYLTLIILNVCHFLGDFTQLSTKWMLSAKANGNYFNDFYDKQLG